MESHEALAIRFLEQLAAKTGGCSPIERFILQDIPVNPEGSSDRGWRPIPWKPGAPLRIDTQHNGYVCVSTFGKAPDGSFRRQKALFQSARAFVIDDVGSSGSAKLFPDTFAHVEPTWIVETSPGNQQWWYLLRPGCAQGTFEALQRSFVDRYAAGIDPGMMGTNRVVRIPGFRNTKPKYGGDFRVTWNKQDGKMWSWQNLAAELKLDYAATYRRPLIAEDISEEELTARRDAFDLTVRLCRAMGVIPRKSEPNLGGWREVVCPWGDEHTGGNKTGADIREPAAENRFYGSFKCFHGHCQGRRWADLTELLNERCVEDLNVANESWGR